jgi:coenzyme F420-reducing hydrogenase beta subunit
MKVADVSSVSSMEEEPCSEEVITRQVEQLGQSLQDKIVNTGLVEKLSPEELQQVVKVFQRLKKFRDEDTRMGISRT